MQEAIDTLETVSQHDLDKKSFVKFSEKIMRPVIMKRKS